MSRACDTIRILELDNQTLYKSKLYRDRPRLYLKHGFPMCAEQIQCNADPGGIQSLIAPNVWICCIEPHGTPSVQIWAHFIWWIVEKEDGKSGRCCWTRERDEEMNSPLKYVLGSEGAGQIVILNKGRGGERRRQEMKENRLQWKGSNYHHLRWRFHVALIGTDGN